MREWVNKQLGDLVAFQKGKKVETSPFPLPGFLPYLGAESLGSDKTDFASTEFAVIANNSDVLMLWDGERSGLIGRGRRGVVSSTVAKLTPNNQIDSLLLYYLLKNNFEWIQNRRTGTGIPHVPKDLSRILVIKFPVNKSHQKKIATILSTIDRAIENTVALIEKYQQIKTGLMHDLFTRGIGEDGKLRPPRAEAPELYKETEIGWIPREWEVEPLSKHIRIIDCKHVTPNYTDEGYPVIRPRNVKIDGLDLSNIDYLSRNDFYFMTDIHKPGKGDIVFSRNASFGIPCYIDSDLEFAIGQDVVIMTKSTSLTKYVYFALLSSNITTQVQRLSGGSTFGRINLGDIRLLQTPKPSIKEQEEVLIRLSSIQVLILNAKEDLSKYNKIKTGLMHDLLTGKVEVTINEAEPANV